jgi:hypothetical protein
MAELTEQEIQAHEKEIAEVTGQVHDGFDVLAGSDPADAQARRFARHEFQQADFESDPTDAIENYSGPRHGSEVKNYNEWHSYLNHQDALGRERHSDWDECLGWAWSSIQREVGNDEARKAELRDLLLQDGFGKRCYEYGKRLKRESQSRAPTVEELEKLDGDQARERLDEWTRTAASAEDKQEPESLITKSEMRRMARLRPADFAAALDAKKAKGW